MSRPAFHFAVSPVGAKFFRLDVVRQHDPEDFFDLVGDLTVEHGRGDLYALIGIARHQIRAGNVRRAIFALAEGIDARMFQKPPHDADHADIFRLLRNTRKQTAYAADNEVYLHARATRLGKLGRSWSCRSGCSSCRGWRLRLPPSPFRSLDR